MRPNYLFSVFISILAGCAPLLPLYVHWTVAPAERPVFADTYELVRPAGAPTRCEVVRVHARGVYADGDEIQPWERALVLPGARYRHGSRFVIDAPGESSMARITVWCVNGRVERSWDWTLPTGAEGVS